MVLAVKRKGKEMEPEGTSFGIGRCECAKMVRIFRGTSYEMEDDGNAKPVPHTCDPQYITDYWQITNLAGKVLAVVFGETMEAGKANALRERNVRESNRQEGGFLQRRIRSHEYKTLREELSR